MSSGELRIAVVGATGLVGSEILSLLEERAFPIRELLPFASDRSDGDVVEFAGDPLTVKRLPAALPPAEVVFLAAPVEVSAPLADAAARSGALVIDLSAAHRRGTVDPESPRGGGRIVTIAPPAATLVATPLRALAGSGRVRRAVVTLLVPASAFGRARVEELAAETAASLNAGADGEETLAFTCRPADGAWVTRIAEAVRELVAVESPPVVNAAEVPTFFGQAASIGAELDHDVSLDEARARLREAPSVVVAEEGATPLGTRDVVSADGVYVVGLHRDAAAPRWLRFWALADNVRHGAALAAVSAAERELALRGAAGSGGGAPGGSEGGSSRRP